MGDRSALETAAARAIAYLDELDGTPVGPTVTSDELRARVQAPLPEDGTDAERVIEDLVRDVTPGLMGSAGGRFFGWVMGGSVPTAVAADWLTSAWDQNAASYGPSPAAAIVEEVCGTWLKELLGLPADASFAFVTGSQMAHVTALAAARNQLLEARGWDVEARGLIGAPPIRVLASEKRHETIVRAVRLLGIGRDAIEPVTCDEMGRVRPDALADALDRAPDEATIVCLQAGDIDTGAFDPFTEACRLAHAVGAWVHVDGAFGLWAAASPAHCHLLEGIEQADSWVTDGHKWLNVPYDSGYVFTAHPAAHKAAFAESASYLTMVSGVRNENEWGPEWSRRARAFATYAAIRALGRRGIAELVKRCCASAEELITGIDEIPGAEVLAHPIINQGLVRFLADDGDHDRRTEAVAARVQEDGTAWLGTTIWHGMRVIRVSVCNWQTDSNEVERTVNAVRKAATGT